MKFIFIADLHVHPFREYSANNGMDRLQDGLNVVKQACELARSHRCPLIIGGDLKYHKDKWYDAVLNGYLDIFSLYHDLTIIIYSGNHDGVKGQPSGLEVFRHVKNIVIITKPIFTKELVGVSALFYPWSPDWKDLAADMAEAKSSKPTLLFGHAFLENARIGGAEIQLKKGIPLLSFGLDPVERYFTWAFFGDIHKQQCLRQFRRNVKGKPVVDGEVWYAGSPYAQRKDEMEPNKGALLVDLNATKVVTPIPLKAPQFLRIDLTAPGDLNVQKLTQQKGNFVDVIAPPKVDPKILEQLRKALEPRTFYVHTQSTKKEAAAKRAEIHAGMTNKELVHIYLKTKPLPDGVSATELAKAGLMLLETSNV